MIMLTSDIALLYDPEYKRLVELYAENKAELERQFSHAWYKLASRDSGPAPKCMGDDVPPAQPWQYPLPPPPADDELADFDAVKTSIKSVMYTPKSSVIPMDEGGYGPLLLRLAWQCSNTFRGTDFFGGKLLAIIHDCSCDDNFWVLKHRL